MSVIAIGWAWKLQLPPTDKLMLVALADSANEEEEFRCWQSIKHLKIKTGLSRSTVCKTINRLICTGLVSKVGLSYRGSTMYQVHVGSTLPDSPVAGSPPAGLVRQPDWGSPVAGLGGSATRTWGVRQTDPNRNMNRNGTVIEPEDCSAKDISLPPNDETGNDATNKPSLTIGVRGKKDVFTLPDWVDVTAWTEWEMYRVEKKKPLSNLAREKCIAVLEKQKSRQKEIIDKSIVSGWTGLFTLKEKPGRRSAVDLVDEAYRKKNNAY